MMASIIQIILFTSLILSALAGAGVGQENADSQTSNVDSENPPKKQECGSQEEVLNGGKCYLFVNELKTYDEAKKACPNQSIALPVSKEENAFLVEEMKKKPVESIWIGGKKNGLEWKDRNGKKVTFVKQIPTGEEGKNCLVLNQTGTWNVSACAEKKSFFCEKLKPSSQNEASQTNNADSDKPTKEQENEASQTNNVDSDKPTKEQDSAAAIAQFSVKGTILLAVASSLMIALGLI